jgi:phage protein D
MTGQRAIPIHKRDEGEETFYVPTFEIKIAGRNLPDNVVRDVMEVTYKDSVNEIDSFDLKINNWDADTRSFKYVGLPQELAEKPDSPLARLFEPGRELQVYMGYGGPSKLRSEKGKLRLMMEGEITALEPDYPGSGPPTLTVRGLNVLHSFRKKQHTWGWYDKKDSEIAREIGRRPVSPDRPGLGIKVDTGDADDDETAHKFVFMNNEYDIGLLLRLARRHGYSLYLKVDERTGERVLHFGSADAERLHDVTYELEWGKSLIRFRPTLTTANQVSQVTVRGWNRHKRKSIVGTAKLKDLKPKINDDQLAVARAVQGRHEVITDKPVRDEKGAKRMARDILRRQRKEMVKASGATVGLPDLRAGRKVIIKKLGQRFSGEYFITQTTHTINDSGYVTTFEARREKGLENER